ncbi:DivIVA domain-containing protein [Butyricicoccus sp. OM04-18BH]|jgi:cell division initiation protein|nr:DivIVA domain-containing protein [Butyricicoccus sp. AM42-5AC]RHT59269.1 DivIVA domain-containing protein [Butyricicoccus sp. AM29-23AC]RHV42894.1 DivIVA domain-containing protein [Butyricicoccus sp. OM04-18BH]
MPAKRNMRVVGQCPAIFPCIGQNKHFYGGKTMTVQEIQEIGFEKAVFGGYDMKSVDTFLERVAEEFAAMQKENASLKAKMKVLVDKIEEYRGVEDGMRRTLMSAQSIAQDTIDKAKKEAEDIIAAAKTETESKVQDTRSEIELEARKLEAARKSTVEFVARVSAAYQAQAKALVELAKAEKLVQPAQTQEAKVDDKTTKIAKPAADEKNAAAVKADAPAEDSTRKFDFGELKFGADYDPKKTK